MIFTKAVQKDLKICFKDIYEFEEHWHHDVFLICFVKL